MTALASGLESVNGWRIAEECGDRSPDATQRLLNRASWDDAAVMSQVRVQAAEQLDREAARSRRRRMTVAALDEAGQEKHGTATAMVTQTCTPGAHLCPGQITIGGFTRERQP